jgi:hypothetical protein
MNFSDILLFSVLENNTENIHILKVKCKMNIWIHSEIRALELQSYYSDVDHSYEIEKYKQLL